MPPVLRFRLIVLCCCIGLVTTVVGCRLYILQIKFGEDFAARAAEQHKQVREVPARRGSLLDRHGRTLALSLETSSFFARPYLVNEPDKAARLLAGKIDLPRRKIAERLRSGKRFDYLHRFLDEETLRALEPLLDESNKERSLLPLGDDGAFELGRETTRRYPRGHVASHVIGFANVDGKGMAGAENRFEEILQGDPTTYLDLRDARSGLRSEIVGAPLRSSSDVFLTMDLSLQHLLERELDAALRKTGAKAATSVMLDPRTGQVLAMANRPTINRDSRRKKRGDRTNRAIEHYFEPGSTFKIVPMALALEHRKISLGQRIYCNDGKPYRTGYNRKIHDVGKNGMLTPRAILAKSSNIGMVKIARKLDAAVLHEGILKFGFGRQTGIELPAETRGDVAPLEKWTAWTRDSVAFGQEIGATALQVASAMATIANDGVRVEPRIGMAWRDAKGAMRRFEPAPRHRVVSAGTARAVRDMLEEVVEKGSGSAARLPGYRVAGKSGTAQKRVSGGAGYSDNEYIASFVGFAPASDPAVVVLVALDSPRGSRRQGGEVAAPVFGGILAEALHYLRVPKDADPPLGTRNVDTTRIVAPPPLTIGTVTPGTVPDVRGRTLREAVATLSAHGYRVRIQGSGQIEAQSPAPGTKLDRGKFCDLRAGSNGAMTRSGRRRGA